MIGTVPAVSIRNVSRNLVSESSEFRLSIPSFNASAGDFVAVVGSSGCGKSTLLDLLGLVARPNAADVFKYAANGEVHDVARHWISHDERALANLRSRTLGYVMQTGGLFPYLSVLDNLLLPARLKNLKPSLAQVCELAESFNLTPENNERARTAFLKKKPRHLSGGQRQRTAIMRALINDPAIVLADEPTAAIDSITAKQIVAKFRELAQRLQLIVVMVSHDRNLVKTVANKAYTFDLSVDSQPGVVTSTAREIPVSQL